ncbi:unannotated protein [freshwater metagenome]|uniref:Unannotated protein n=1 Tax=freshwater metagenome TaxID=449393 RepID=A0A6J6HSL5_9ZZZZ
MICCNWVKRSTFSQSASVTIPIGASFSTTINAPCARLVIRSIASATVSVGFKVTGVSKIKWRDLTQLITSATISSGISCGITAMPPRRATVSAIRRPEIAVMFATTKGIVVPALFGEVRSTSMRLAISECDGTMKTSS